MTSKDPGMYTCMHCKKKWVVLTHFSYLSFIYPFPHDWTISLANYSPVTFANELENLIKFLICLKSKAGSGTPLCLTMHAEKRKLR